MFLKGTSDLGNGYVSVPGMGQMSYGDFLSSNASIGAPSDFLAALQGSVTPSSASGVADPGDGYAGSDASSAASLPPWLSQEPFDNAAFQWNQMSPDKAYEHFESILDRQYTTAEREAAQEYNSSEAVKAYERELAADSTKYQRLVSDLRAAGINPMVAFSSGSASASGVSSSGGTSSGGSASKASAKGSVANSAAAIASVILTLGKLAAMFA